MLATFFYKALTTLLLIASNFSSDPGIEDSAVIAFDINGGELLSELDVVSQKGPASFEIRPPISDPEYDLVTVNVNDDGRVCKLLALTKVYSTDPTGDTTQWKLIGLALKIEHHCRFETQMIDSISADSPFQGRENWVKAIHSPDRHYTAHWSPPYSRTPEAIERIRADLNSYFPSDHSHSAAYQQSSDVALPHFGNSPQPLFAAGRMLLWD